MSSMRSFSSNAPVNMNPTRKAYDMGQSDHTGNSDIANGRNRCFGRGF